MITLTIAVPQNDAILSAGYATLRVSKSTSGTPLGPFVAVTPDITLIPGTTSYPFLDMQGVLGDWYTTQYVTAMNGLSSASPPEPGYLTQVCQSIRDLLGVSTVEASDVVIQELGFLPNAFARLRQRLATFDTIVYAGGDPSNLAISALSYLTAALLCSRMSMQVMNAERFKDYSYTRDKSLDWSALSDKLLMMYETMISQAAGETSLSSALYPNASMLTGPSRTGTDTSAGLVTLENDVLPVTLSSFVQG